jgi:membrane-bound metal-dependent hydrolase YbcI (DUF457 family)
MGEGTDPHSRINDARCGEYICRNRRGMIYIVSLFFIPLICALYIWRKTNPTKLIYITVGGLLFVFGLMLTMGIAPLGGFAATVLFIMPFGCFIGILLSMLMRLFFQK